MSISIERVYLELRDEVQLREALETRVQVLEHFIKDQFPGYFAGEVVTVVDPDLHDTDVTFGAAQERFNQDTQAWERRNADSGEWEPKPQEWFNPDTNKWEPLHGAEK